MGAHSPIPFYIILNVNPSDLDACSDAWYKIGFEAYRLNFSKEAISYYKKAIGLNPNNSEAWKGICQTAQELVLYDESIMFCDVMLEINSTNVHALNCKKEISKIQQDIAEFAKTIKSEDAAYLFEQGKKIFNRVNNGKSYARVYFDKAIFGKNTKANPHYFSIYIDWLWKMEGVSLSVGQMPYLDEILRLSPNDVRALHLRAELLESDQLYDEAIAHYNKVLELYPEYYHQWKEDCFRTWSSKGQSLFFKKLYNEAIVCFDEAIKLIPDESEIQIENFYSRCSTKRLKELKELALEWLLEIDSCGEVKN